MKQLVIYIHGKSDKLIDGFDKMLSVFMDTGISEIFYERNEDAFKTVYC